MWRAYGGKSGIAIVLNNRPFFNESDAFKAFTAPVLYADDVKFEDYFNKIVSQIRSNIDVIKTQDREVVKGLLFNTFLILSLSVKHPGFKEELEWRIIYPEMEESKYLKSEIKCISGTPQKIFKIPLNDLPEEGLLGIEIPALLDKIIVGPCDNASEIMQAFEVLLKEAGVENPKERIIFSNIPLRT
jgi:hypothetical protein